MATRANGTELPHADALVAWAGVAYNELKVTARSYNRVMSYAALREVVYAATEITTDIVNVRDNTWGAFEIKLGHDTVDEAGESLLRFAWKVDVSKHGEPGTLSVIISNGSYAYRREDGVHVIPIGCLGP